jgi:hypothetical protein
MCDKIISIKPKCICYIFCSLTNLPNSNYSFLIITLKGCPKYEYVIACLERTAFQNFPLSLFLNAPHSSYVSNPSLTRQLKSLVRSWRPVIAKTLVWPQDIPFVLCDGDITPGQAFLQVILPSASFDNYSVRIYQSTTNAVLAIDSTFKWKLFIILSIDPHFTVLTTMGFLKKIHSAPRISFVCLIICSSLCISEIRIKHV